MIRQCGIILVQVFGELAFASGAPWRTSPQLPHALAANARTMVLTNGASFSTELKITAVE